MAPPVSSVTVHISAALRDSELTERTAAAANARDREQRNGRVVPCMPVDLRAIVLRPAVVDSQVEQNLEEDCRRVVFRGALTDECLDVDQRRRLKQHRICVEEAAPIHRRNANRA